MRGGRLAAGAARSAGAARGVMATEVREQTRTRDQLGAAWQVIVHNDPVNLMSYVVMVLQKLFGYSKERATVLMMQIHNDGRAVVADGSREQAEAHVAQLHGYGLWATMERA